MVRANLLWLIAGCLMLQPLSTDLYLPSLPHLATYFSADPAGVQQTLSAFVFGFAVAQLVSGPLSDRFGRRPILLGGLAIYLLGCIVCGLAPTLNALIVARFVQAIGGCTAVVVSRAIVRDAFSPIEGAKIIARASSMLAIAPLCGPVAGGYLQVAFGWRAAFALMAVFCILLGAIVMRGFEETNQHPNPGAIRFDNLARNYRTILQNPSFWAFALPGCLSYANIFVFISGSSFVLIRVFGIKTETYGWLFALGVTGYLTGTIVCRRLLSAIGMQRTLGLGAAAAFAAGLIILGCANAGAFHWSLIVAAQFFAMLAHGINFPCTQTGAVAPFPQQAGAAAGLFGFFSMLGAMTAGYCVGETVSGTIYPLLQISAATSTLLMLATVLFWKHRQ